MDLYLLSGTSCKRVLTAICTFVNIAILAALTPASAAAQATLRSNLPDYPAGAIVELTGTAFEANESVSVQVVHGDGSPSTGPEHEPWEVQADSHGHFVTTWVTCGDDCAGVMMLASADGGSGGAETSFFSHVCGDGVVSSVTPVGGECVDFTPAVGNGPDNWEVQEGGTYQMTITGVTECTDSTITVFIQNGSTGNFCFNATGGGGTYTGTFTMPNPACNTSPISYKCGANAACTHANSFGASGPTSGCGGVHLRASTFDGSCNKTGHDTSCSGGCTGCTLTCPPDTTVDCSASTAPANTGSPTGCANATYSDDIEPGECAGSYVIEREWSAPNGCGGFASCTQTITVTDMAGPDIDCPPDITVDCDDSTDPADTGTATATDDCSGATVDYSDSVDQPDPDCAARTITRTWTAVDGCGNPSSCDQIITVTDTTDPDIDCPADVTVDCGDSTDPADTGTPTASDCSDVTFGHTDSVDQPDPDCATRTITRTWTATDGCGNSSSCDQIITVTDSTPPDIDCPANVTVDCGDSTDPADTGTATATDDCSGATVDYLDSVNQPDPDCATRTITRTWTAVDGCGNPSSCDQIITVTDSTAPDIDCPPDVTVSGCCTPVDIGEPVVTDDCSEFTVTNDAPDEFCEGETTVTWTAMDACGNSSTCEQLVTVTGPETLDFETDGAGNPLLHGQSLVTVGPEAPYPCLTISSSADPVTPGTGNNGAAVFNSTSGPFGQDPDLDVDLGNVLYVQRNGGPTDAFTGLNGPDTWDHPNDDEDGGQLIFDFCTGIEPLSINLIDIDPATPDNDSTVTLTDSSLKTRTYSVPGGWTANGPGALAVGLLSLNASGNQPSGAGGPDATESTQAGFDPTDVIKIVVRLGSSGAVDNLIYCVPGFPRASVTVRNGSGMNPVIFTPSTLPYVGETWHANLDCSAYAHGVAAVTLRQLPTSGVVTLFGEVLVQGPMIVATTQAFAESVSQVTWDIPNDLSLLGLRLHAQGLCRGNAPLVIHASSGTVPRRTLSNALDLVLGF